MNADQIMGVHAAAIGWCAEASNRPEKESELNLVEAGMAFSRSYLDLMFAFALARAGDNEAAKRLASRGEMALASGHPAERFLAAAYRHRVDQAIRGEPLAGQLPPELATELAGLRDVAKRADSHDLEKLTPYVISRLRAQSHILEPDGQPDVYRGWKRHTEGVQRQASDLPDIENPAELRAAIDGLLLDASVAAPPQSHNARLYVLVEALPLGTRVGEEFTLELLQQVVPALEESAGSPEPLLIEQQCKLLERAMFFAAYHNRAEVVRTLVDWSMKLLYGKSGKLLYETINLFAGQNLRSLRRLHMSDEVHRMLQAMTQVVLQGQDLDALLRRHIDDWPAVLRSLLYVSAYRMYLGQTNEALPVLDEAVKRLAGHDPADPRYRQWHIEYARLASTYAEALGQAPERMAVVRLGGMFKVLSRVANTFATSAHYSRLHMSVAEAAVLALSDSAELTGSG
jgi:hypothetical protein